MFKKAAFLVLATSFLLVLVLGCQAPRKKSASPADAKREAIEAKVEADVEGAPQENPNIVDSTDDWIKKNLW